MSILMLLLSLAAGVIATVTTAGLFVVELWAGHVPACVLLGIALLLIVATTGYMTGTCRGHGGKTRRRKGRP